MSTTVYHCLQHMGQVGRPVCNFTLGHSQAKVTHGCVVTCNSFLLTAQDRVIAKLQLSSLKHLIRFRFLWVLYQAGLCTREILHFILCLINDQLPFTARLALKGEASKIFNICTRPMLTPNSFGYMMLLTNIRITFYQTIMSQPVAKCMSIIRHPPTPGILLRIYLYHRAVR